MLLIGQLGLSVLVATDCSVSLVARGFSFLAVLSEEASSSSRGESDSEEANEVWQVSRKKRESRHKTGSDAEVQKPRFVLLCLRGLGQLRSGPVGLCNGLTVFCSEA